jgi:hypothetical protein
MTVVLARRQKKYALHVICEYAYMSIVQIWHRQYVEVKWI